MKKKITVKVPATSANLGPGFDTFGAALELRNTLIVETQNHGGRSSPEIIVEGEGKDSLPRGKSNLVWRSMEKVFAAARLKRVPPVRLTMLNKIPLSSGLGSSAAAVVGGVLAANEICYNKLPSERLIQIAVEMEGHPDNAVPAFAGGFCVCFGNGKFTDYVRVPLSRAGVRAAVCVPEIDLPTQKARGILPDKVPLEDAVYNISRSAVMLAALSGLASRALLRPASDDRLHQTKRMKHIPGARAAFAAAFKAGAYGACLSGAGPSILALVPPARASAVVSAMTEVFRRRKTESRGLALDFTDTGAQIR